MRGTASGSFSARARRCAFATRVSKLAIVIRTETPEA